MSEQQTLEQQERKIRAAVQYWNARHPDTPIEIDEAAIGRVRAEQADT